MAVKRKRDNTESPLTRSDETKAPAKSSLVQQDAATEMSFPRGGASVLTPLELKQVANEAASDVLFSKEAQTTSSKDGKPVSKKSKKNSKKSQDNDVENDEDIKTSSQIVQQQHISFRTLPVGSLLLGQVSRVHNHGLTISLPDNLTGYVPITNVSKQIDDILEKLNEDQMKDDEAQDSGYESDEEEESDIKKPAEQELPHLNDFFKVGQWLRCAVTKNTALENSKKVSKKIELTIEPSVVNKGLEKEDVQLKFSTIQCSVKSVEDHGAMLDLGLEDASDLTGFIAKKDLVDSSVKLVPGYVFLGTVSKYSGRTVSITEKQLSSTKPVSTISSVDAIVPGQLVDFLVDSLKEDKGVFGKVFGLANAFLSISQMKTKNSKKFKDIFEIGSNIKTRVIANILYKGERVVLLSQLPATTEFDQTLKSLECLESFPIGYTFENKMAIIAKDSQYLYVQINDNLVGQIHFSKHSEESEEFIEKARVLGYNTVDNLFVLTNDKDQLAMEYLRSQDIPIGKILTGCEIVTVSAEKGIELKILNGHFKAMVPPKHISDIKLVYPERKFKIGSTVKGRVINVNPLNGKVFVSLKKTIVNADVEETPLVSTYDQLAPGLKTLCTVETFKDNGAVVTLLGNLRAFLPNKEISESFVKRPQDHLRLGQTVPVKIVNFDKENRKISVSCKIISQEKLEAQKHIIDSMQLGRSIVQCVVVEKTKDSAVVELKSDHTIRGVVYAGHLSDQRIEQNRSNLKKLKIGSELEGLVIDKDPKTKVFNITCKTSLIKDSQSGDLPLTFSDVTSKATNAELHGYIKTISSTGIFVAFNGKFVGLVLPSYSGEDRNTDLAKKFYINQSVTCYLLRTDEENERFLLSFKDPASKTDAKTHAGTSNTAIINPIDKSVKTMQDLTMGKIVTCKVKQVKRTQLNVILADSLQGRVDISQAFNSFSDIKDIKNPLAQFKKDDILKVKIIGTHNIKTHTFLPISHTSGKNAIFELSAKLDQEEIPKLSSFKVDDSELYGFVNNYSKDFLWLTINPQVKAKLNYIDLSDNTSDLNDIQSAFPIGSAISCKTVSVDNEHECLVTRSRFSSIITSYQDVKVGDKLPCRITKISDSYVLVNLGNGVKAISFITTALDDFKNDLKTTYHINQVVVGQVLAKDDEEQKINVSLIKNPDSIINSASDLQVGQVVDALVKNVTDKGLFVYLSSTINAFVPVSKLSDSYIKDWKKFYKPLQHVLGKVVTAESNKRISLTLRESEINGDIQILKTIKDIQKGDVFEGVVRNVTDFGVFVKLDKTVNVTGLAHVKEISDSKIEGDLSDLFGEGDKVKAYVLKTNPEKNQLSLSLKASRFKIQDAENDVDMDAEAENEDAEEVEEDEVMDIDYNDEASDDEDVKVNAFNGLSGTQISLTNDGLSLSAGFDWTGSILNQANEDSDGEENDEDEDFTAERRKSKKNRASQIVEDKTIDIAARAPESVADFERMILGNPNSSVVWMNYMAFQLQLGEIDKAREIAERALKTINFREEMEKLNIWIAKLNLENTFGSPETLEEVFKQSCQYMDSYVMHMKMIGVYQMSAKVDEALSLFKAAAKKFGSEKVSIWVNWGEYLIDQQRADEAHAILASALQSLAKRDHIEVVKRFAQLEFKKGDPEQGRSLFEGLLADAPKKIDLWNVYVDQEIKHDDKTKVEDLFERIISNVKITKKQAKFFFKKWLDFEENKNDTKTAEYVKAKAAEYVQNAENK